MFTLEEIRKVDVKKLAEELQTAEKELFKKRFEVKSGQSKAGHNISKYKKYIAQIKTILAERHTTT